MRNTQPGITPPVPGQDKEEPDLWHEDDIPSDDNRASASSKSEGRDADSKPERGERDD
jgi:hypothetical protein